MKTKKDGFVKFQPLNCLHQESSQFIFSEFFEFHFLTKFEVPKRLLSQ